MWPITKSTEPQFLTDREHQHIIKCRPTKFQLKPKCQYLIYERKAAQQNTIVNVSANKHSINKVCMHIAYSTCLLDLSRTHQVCLITLLEGRATGLWDWLST